MPYIKTEDRHKFDLVVGELLEAPIATTGELNYLITTLCQAFMLTRKESYDNHNAVMGVLECVKQEWYRRSTAKYEDVKIAENGDVRLGKAV